MDHTTYVNALQREGTALADAAEANLDAPIEHCPGWTERDLLFHVGRLHNLWHQIVSQGIDMVSAQRPEQPDDDALVDWYRSGLAQLVSTLGAHQPDEPGWTWATEQTVGFVQRRMAQETMVHRWDAQNAVGVADPFGTELAIDGVDEFVFLFLGERRAASAAEITQSVHIHATDGPGEWLVDSDGSAFVITRGHEKGAAALRGTASDLLLVVWHRLGLDALDVVGDRAAAEALLSVAHI